MRHPPWSGAAPRRALAVILLILLGAMALAACADGDGDDEDGVASLADDEPGQGDDAEGETGSSGDVEDIDFEEAQLEYAQCMRDEGVDFPDPGAPADMDIFDDPGFEAAAEACQHIIEAAFGDFEITPEMRAEMRDAILRLAECLRDEGIDFPDPTFDEQGLPQIDDSALDPEDPEALAAMEGCLAEMMEEEGFGP